MLASPSKSVNAVLWALAQSWGGKLIVFLFFLLLTRLINPADVGVASACLLVIQILWIVSEFGFGDAFVQKRELALSDINLPLLLSLCVSVFLFITIFVFRFYIARILGISQYSSMLIAIALILPFQVLEKFQEAVYRRELKYKELATRTLASSFAAGILGVVLAYLGFRAWSLIIQYATTVIISLCWLWAAPIWRPSSTLSVKSFIELFKFGKNIFYSRVLDFFTTRSIDFVIVAAHGAAALGFYSVGSRLYTTLMILFQSAVSDVGLSILSKMQGDMDKYRRTYLRIIRLSGILAVPMFVFLSTVSKEFCFIVFGGRWSQVELVMTPLLLLGSLQCVQFLNTTFMLAVGKSSFMAWLQTIKFCLTVFALALASGTNVFSIVWVYCVLQIIVTPISYYLLCREIGLSVRELVSSVVPVYLIGYLPMPIIWLFKALVLGSLNIYLVVTVEGLLYFGSYIMSMHVFMPATFGEVRDMVLRKLTRAPI